MKTIETTSNADVTLKQLGGQGRLRAMINARNFFSNHGGRTLQFDFSGWRKANRCEIELLEGDDVYTVRFFRIPRNSTLCTLVAEFECVYCDELVARFESETGLRLAL